MTTAFGLWAGEAAGPPWLLLVLEHPAAAAASATSDRLSVSSSGGQETFRRPDEGRGLWLAGGAWSLPFAPCWPFPARAPARPCRPAAGGASRLGARSSGAGSTRSSCAAPTPVG